MIHINSILSTIDNPETLENIRTTAGSVSSVAVKLDKLSTDLGEIINNEEFTDAIQKAALGIGKLFDDIYR